MRITLTLLLALTIELCTASQDPSSALLLQSGTVYPENNIEKFISTPVGSDEITDGYYFRIVQFSEYPDEQLKNALSAAGIILNNYLPYRSYNCAIPAGFDKNKANALKFSSVIKWEDNFKLSRKINGMDFPSYSIVEKGHADLVVHYQQNLEPSRAGQLITGDGFRITVADPQSHTITIRMPFESLNHLLSLPFVYYVEAVAMPSIKDDTEGRSLHRSNMINTDYITGRHYDGSGVVIGLADDGEIGPHIDFTGRVIQHLSGAGGNHGDMTSGICVGAGNLIPRIRGMATGSTLHVFDITSYPQIHDAVNNYSNYGIVITSTSYAQNCNEYNADSQLGDQLINQNSQFSFCFSAGNAGTTDCSYGAGNLWGNITGGFKMGKNVIAVGNLRNTDSLETSSSRGPAVDGRIKPDICSNGYDQRSTDQGNTYQVGGGTSAACPGVAGCLAQLYEAYKEINNASDVPSGLMKACILNTAEDLGIPGPDYKFGWGRIDSYRALRTIEQNRYFIDSIAQGQQHTRQFTVPAGITELRVMIYWHDVEGAVASAKNLVNDLNLTVTNNATTYLPLVPDPTPNVANLTTPAVPGVDSLNNAEQVRIANPVAGTYTVNVDGFQIPVGVQKYFIVYDFGGDSVTITYPNGGEGLVPSETELIRWDATGDSGTFDIDYSSDGGSNWTNLTTGIPGTERYFSWTVPVMANDQMLMRVSRNGYSDQSDTMFTIMRVPQNLHVTYECPDSIGLAWNSVQGATGYEISMLGTKYMDFVGTTTATAYKLTGINPSNDYWFSVKALGPHGGKGCRADAINQPPGLLNCSLAIDGAIQLISPAGGLMADCQNLSSIPVTVELSNPGINSLSNIDIHYQLDNGATITENFPGPIPFAGTAVTSFLQTVSLTSGPHTFRAWLTVAGDQNLYNDTAVITMNVVSGTQSPLGTTEPFTSFAVCSTASDCEVTLCTLGNGWLNASNGTQDDIDWRVSSGATPSASTGPSGDHTSNSGKYIYLEASTCYQKEAMLISPCFDLTGTVNPVLTFWYHMYGASMGDLHIDVMASDGIHPDIIPVRSGDQGDLWQSDSANLSQFIGQNVSIRFRGVTGIDYTSDMALDDIGVSDNPLAVYGIDHDNSIRIYPNPSNGIFHVSVNNFTGYEITVMDALGNVVMLQNLSGSGRLDLSSQPVGVYTAIVKSEKVNQQFKLMNIKK